MWNGDEFMPTDKLLNLFSKWSPNLLLNERLEALTELIRYWYESIAAEQSRANLRLPGFLPISLQWLYKTVAKYNDQAFTSNYGEWTDGDPILTFHWLKRPVDITCDEGNYCKFLNENQGVYQCAILNSTDDPAVFIRNNEQESWSKQSEKLTDFMLILIVFEITLNGLHDLYLGSGSFPVNVFNNFARQFVGVKTEYVSWWGTNDISAYLGKDITFLSIRNHDGTVYIQAVTKTEQAVATMELLGEWEYDFTKY